MADKFTRFLTGVVNGATNPKGQMGNFRHATRMFVDNNYALAPRTKFMFYVQFDIDSLAAGATVFKMKHAREVGILCKSADLPKFTFDQITKNQYNRKKIIYKQINYDPINLTFHDDNTGVINALWALYYGAYVVDRQLPNAAYKANHYRPAGQIMNNYAYGLDNNVTVPFIKSISIYTMSRRRYNGYTLVNPKIINWNHGSMSYAEGGTAESTMQVAYESVQYSTGKVYQNNPKGFANQAYYDLLPSPLSVAGGGTVSLLGEGGVLAGADQVFQNFADGTAYGSIGGFLNTAIAAVNTAQNIASLTKEGLASEALNLLTSDSGIDVGNVVSGVQGAFFPKNDAAQAATQASQRNLTGQ